LHGVAGSQRRRYWFNSGRRQYDLLHTRRIGRRGDASSSAKAKADDQHLLILRRSEWTDFISIRCGAIAQDRREGG